MSQSARSGPSTTNSAAIGAAVVAASAGSLALVARAQNTDYKGISMVGGAILGAGAASLGGAVVAATSKKWHKAGLATTLIGLGGIGTLFVGLAVSKALQPTPPNPVLPVPPPVGPPAPPASIAWTQIPITSALTPHMIYRLSDAATASELQNTPSLTAVQTSMGPAFQVDGVWTGAPPTGWIPADSGANNRVYVEFLVTKPAQLPTGLTSAARLFVQQASQA